MRKMFLAAVVGVVAVWGAHSAALEAFDPQTMPACSPADVSLTESTLSVDPVGSFYRPAKATLSVHAPGNCVWTVAVSGFVAIASGQSSYTAAAVDVPLMVGSNPSPTQRVAAIVVQGHVAVLFQSGRPARTVAMDLDGDGRAELCSMDFDMGFDRYNWSCDDKQNPLGRLRFALGLRTDKLVPADYNGDHITDPAVFRPSTGEWFILEAGVIRIVHWGLPGDIPVAADYDGNGAADVAVYRPSEGAWYMAGRNRVLTGVTPGATPVPGDYDADGIADPAVYYAGGSWTVSGSRDRGFTLSWGQAGDIPVPGDYDGAGRAEAAVFRPSTGEWFVKDVLTLSWGRYGDIPLPLDYDGEGKVSPVVLRQTSSDDASGEFFVRHNDGSAGLVGGSYVPMMALPTTLSTVAGETDSAPDRRADLTVFRPAEGKWYTTFSSSGYQRNAAAVFGVPSDQPVGADLGFCLSATACPGLGNQRPAVFAAGTWHTAGGYFGSGSATVQWGIAGDIPLPGDYLGQSYAQLAVFRPSSGTWYVQGLAPVKWGQSGDVPVPADFDGDGRLDVAVWRPSDGSWSVLCSSGKAALYQVWGASGDIPLAADYDGDGRADFAVFRPSNGTWYVFLQFSYNRFHTVPPRGASLPNTLTVQFGAGDDVPVPTDYDGDSIADMAVWTPATGMWSAPNGLSVRWGQVGDIPVVTLNR